MRDIGLHIRVTTTILHALDYASRLGMPIFQCFLINQINHKPLQISTDTAQLFQEKAQNHRLYVHASYWINLANIKKRGLSIIKNEIAMAKKLGANHIIFHPGSAIDMHNRIQAIDSLARTLNTIMTDEKDITIILENTAHARKSIGSDLTDFYLLKQKIEYPSNLRFCIDTAHAHAYGYDITTPQEQEIFLDLIDQTIGIDMVELIHLNDATYPLCSRIDKHAVLGEGTIGYKALKSFTTNPRLRSIPLILELPVLSESQDSTILNIVRHWVAI